MSKVRILQGDVFDTLPTVEPGSIDCAVTSPPYWMLRSYLPKGHPLKALELGHEASPADYVRNMVRVCGLVRDALADHGLLFLNVGDTYSSKPAGCSGVSRSSTLNGARGDTTYRETLENSVSQKGDTTKAVEAGNLCLIPQRLMIALQDDGWLVRSVVVWHKPSPMPTSVTGWMWKRCRVKAQATTGPRKSREDGRRNPNESLIPGAAAEWADCPGCKRCTPHGGYVLRKGSWRPTSAWEPVIMLAKSANYFADGEGVKTPAESTVSRDAYTRVIDDPDEQFAVKHDHETACVSGANLRDVWRLAAEPLKAAHYAAFPSELVFRCLRAGTSQEGYCDACGKPFVRVVESEFRPTQDPANGKGGRKGLDESNDWGDTPRGITASRTLGWRPSCSCPGAKPRPGRVLDPFCGSGRTAVVATRLQMDFTGCELNPDYAAMAAKIVRDDAPLFNDFGDDSEEG